MKELISKVRNNFDDYTGEGEKMEIDAQPILVSEIPEAPKRVMNRYDYTYLQCCTMPLNLLIFLHDCARMEEEND